ncbi:MAG: ParA family protein [Ilumatobacteraceae bacterium]
MTHPKIAIWNEKGGCGKTTTAVSLAAEAARHQPTLLIDIDPQANATDWLLGDVPDGLNTLDVLAGRATIAQAARPVPGMANLTIIAGHAKLARAAAELEDDPVPQLALRRALAGWNGIVIIDCPPAFGELAIMALAACTHHLITLKAAAMDLKAAKRSLARAAKVTALNPELTTAGFVIAGYDARKTLAASTRQHLETAYPELTTWVIPAAAVVELAPGAHQTLDTYAPTSPATTGYRTAAHGLGIAA